MDSRRLSKCLTLILCVILSLLSTSSHAANVGQLVIKNAGIARTVSGAVDIIKTTKLTANGVQFLDQPSVEFMIDLDVKGKSVRLVPSDFHIETVESVQTGRETRTSFALISKHDAFPQLIVFVDYFYEPKLKYMHKSVAIKPCKNCEHVTIKQVIVESMRIKRQFQPLLMDGSLAEESNYAVYDPESRKGLYFFINSPKGLVAIGGSYLTVAETTDAPLSKGFASARVTIGSAAGESSDIFVAYRDLILDVRWPDLARSKSFAAFKKRFAKQFSHCSFVGMRPFGGPVDGAAYGIGGQGFVLLLNSTDEPRKTILPLDRPELRLAGEVKVTDWTDFESAVHVGIARVGETFNVDIPPNSFRIIGVNID
jgi:hypothetical protein